MSHNTARESYRKLTERLNRFPQGAPPSDMLYQILQVLFSSEEAELLALLPIKPFTVKNAAEIWKKTEAETENILDKLADRGMLLDVHVHRERAFVMPPPMAGFFEFSMMRIGNQYDQKLLAELFHQYISVEEDFIRALLADGETQIGRTFVNEQALPQNTVHVLDYERATEVINAASHIGIGACYCRHKMEHMGRACNAPMDVCMTFNSTARSLIKHGIARQIEAAECQDLLLKAKEHNLVQFGENVRDQVSFICNCCGCCCEAMLGAKRFAAMSPIATTNFIPEIDQSECNGCGRCAEVCPVEAMAVVSAADPHRPKRRKAKLDESVCLGCGVCVRNCKKSALKLRARDTRVITPVNTAHRTVLMAIERGKLQDLIFDNRALWSHRAMATILGVILKLPPIKQAMASKQMKSHYFEQLLTRKSYGHNHA
jgi:ferredoxin